MTPEEQCEARVRTCLAFADVAHERRREGDARHWLRKAVHAAKRLGAYYPDPGARRPRFRPGFDARG